MKTTAPLALTFAILLMPLAQAHAQTWTCKHSHGDRAFKNAPEIKVLRSAVSVKVTGVPGPGISPADEWTYRVMFEAPGVGFRAIRSARPEGGSSMTDAILGGELFLTQDEGKLRLLVTAVNAASTDMSFEIFVCKSAA